MSETRISPGRRYSDLLSKRWTAVGDFGAYYAPLIDTPHLFLEFARLHERPNPEEAILEWVSKYGVLGFQEFRADKYDIVVFEGEPHRGMFPEYSRIGGPQELLPWALSEAHRANWVLAAYEATLSKDVEKLELFRENLPLTADLSVVTYADALVDKVMRNMIEEVQEVLAQYTFPCIAHRWGSVENPPHVRLWRPDQLIRSLYPRNLLGAMYLQFYWLVTSEAELSRCKQCDRIIPYTSMSPSTTARTRANRVRIKSSVIVGVGKITTITTAQKV